MTPNDLGLLCVCATRYAMGRMTYMPSEVCRVVDAHLNEINENDLRIIARNIEDAGDAIKTDGYDGECWLRLLHDIRDKVGKI